MAKQAQLNKEEARQLRGLAGQLNWVSSQTRPEMAYSAYEVSVYTKNATIVDLFKANKNIASFANLKNNSSERGYIASCFLQLHVNQKYKNSGQKHSCSWHTSFLTSPRRKFYDQIIYLWNNDRQVSEEFLSIKCYIDNESLIDSIYSTNTVTEKKLLE